MFRAAIRSAILCLLLGILPRISAEDEDRPYEFSFNIVDFQHRRERKDREGLITGEYGFVTADGVYHETGYRTDKNDDFIITRMTYRRIKSLTDVQEIFKDRPEAAKKLTEALDRACGSCRIDVKTDSGGRTRSSTSGVTSFTSGISETARSFGEDREFLPLERNKVPKDPRKLKSDSGGQTRPSTRTVTPSTSGISETTEIYGKNREFSSLKRNEVLDGPKEVKSDSGGQTRPSAHRVTASTSGISETTGSFGENPEFLPLGRNEIPDDIKEVKSDSGGRTRQSTHRVTASTSGISETTETYGKNREFSSLKRNKILEELKEVKSNSGGQTRPSTHWVTASTSGISETTETYGKNREFSSLKRNKILEELKEVKSNSGGQTRPSAHRVTASISGISDTTETFSENREFSPLKRNKIPEDPKQDLSKDLAKNLPEGLRPKERRGKSFAEEETRNKIDSPGKIGGKESSHPRSKERNVESLSTGKHDYSTSTGNDLYYRFNYTITTHEHQENGYRSGKKDGSYRARGENGVDTRVKYLSNEFGHQPNISFVPSVHAPNEDHRLKGYSFIWYRSR